MKKSEKAALFSGLVFPGVGHFILKRYVRGMVFFVPSMLGLIFIVDNVIQRTSSAIDKILSGAASSDMATITRLVSASESDSLKLNIATAVLIACWVISVIDSYRIGRLEESANERRESGK